MILDNAILELILKLDCSDFTEIEEYWAKVKIMRIDIPRYFREVYPGFKKWQGRVHLVFSCVRYARISEDAFQLGVMTLNDKATLVRYRAASLLAYSLRDDAIKHLQRNLNHKDEKTRKDSERAIRAIQAKNHHLFMIDRADKWIINKDDELT